MKTKLKFTPIHRHTKACDLPDCGYCAECGMGSHNNFAERVKNWVDEGEIIREGLWHEGPELIARITDRMSLRDLARRVKLSPTYLSRVSNAEIIISTQSYLILSALEAKP